MYTYTKYKYTFSIQYLYFYYLVVIGIKLDQAGTLQNIQLVVLLFTHTMYFLLIISKV